MATAIEYGLIAAGISVAIIAVVNGTSNLSITKKQEPVAPVVKPELQFAAREGKLMSIVKELDSTKGNGFKAIVVSPGYWSDNAIALVPCNNPQIDREKKTANVSWFNTNDGQRGYFVLCN